MLGKVLTQKALSIKENATLIKLVSYASSYAITFKATLKDNALKFVIDLDPVFSDIGTLHYKYIFKCIAERVSPIGN